MYIVYVYIALHAYICTFNLKTISVHFIYNPYVRTYDYVPEQTMGMVTMCIKKKSVLLAFGLQIIDRKQICLVFHCHFAFVC